MLSELVSQAEICGLSPAASVHQEMKKRKAAMHGAGLTTSSSNAKGEGESY